MRAAADELIRLVLSDKTIAAAAATLVASVVGLFAVLLVAWINARATRNLARLNALRDYRLKQSTELIAFLDERLREFLLLRTRRSESVEFDAFPEAVKMTANDHRIAPRWHD